MNDAAIAIGWRWGWRHIILAMAILFLLMGCGERASTWSDKQGRYRPTEEVQREIINDEIDKREMDRGK